MLRLIGAGGLVLAVPEDRAGPLLRRLEDAGVRAAAVGRVVPRGNRLLRVKKTS